MTWLQSFLESTKELESPQRYFYWSILSSISAAISKRVWISRGGVYNLYPNIYVFLISKKSGLRKGVPINVAKKLANDLGKIRVIDGQNSVQGVIKELSRVKTVGNGWIIKNAEGFLITGEFASFLIQDGFGFSLTTLTDLYDAQYHEQGYTKRLVSEEEIELKSPCITGLFASNETHFFDSVPRNAISGGFLARTFCIYEEKRNKINSLTGERDPIPERIDYPRMVDRLLYLSKLGGQIVVEKKALIAFDDWYYTFCAEEHEDYTGTSERLGDNIWKAAMLISLANSNDMIIYESDMLEAIEKSIQTFSDLKRLLLGGSGEAQNVKSITMRTALACLLEAEPIYEIERKLILRKGAGVFGVYDLDESVEHMLQAGMITVSKRGQGIYYKLSDFMINRHLELRRKEGNGGVTIN